jgi:thioredoxin 1
MPDHKDNETARSAARIPRWIFALVIVALAVGVYMMRPAAHSRQGLDGQADTGPEAVADLPRLLDLGADKCIPCKLMAPILEELKVEYAGTFTVEFIDVWKNSGASAEYGIKVIPTQIFFAADGTELFRHEGFYGKEDILAKWRELGIGI